MDLNAIHVFVKVVQAGSFIGASRDLDMPSSTVSRKVSQLESQLGARLLHRTTRKLSLTDEGHAFYQHAARVIAEAEEATLAVSRLQERPRGRLRLTAPLNFAHLGPIIASFLERYPEVQLELFCTDRTVDLIQEGFDVALRAGQLADSSLFARPIGTIQSYVVASPAFLERHGLPDHPRQLERFDCLVFSPGEARTSWKLCRGDDTFTAEVRPRFTANDFDFLDKATLSGLGLAILPHFRCHEHLREGRLTRVLPEWSAPELPLHAVYPSSRHLSPKVQALLDHLYTHRALL